MAMHHLKRLWPSNEGDVGLIEVILERMGILADLHRRVRGTEIAIPTEIGDDIKKLRTLSNRYMQQDFRHSEAEMIAARHIAQWTVDLNSRLRSKRTTEIPWLSKS